MPNSPATGICPDDRNRLTAAAHLHDVGYAEPLATTGFRHLGRGPIGSPA
jgi:hypothetical protein